MKILLNIIVLAASLNISFGQTTRELSIDLENLRFYSIDYDLYTNRLKDEEYEEKRIRAVQLYTQQIQKISQGPQSAKFEAFLKDAIERDSVSLNKRTRYNYLWVSPAFVFPADQLPTNLDYYKVVYYSLFVKKANELLPHEHFDFLRDKKTELMQYIEVVPGDPPLQ